MTDRAAWAMADRVRHHAVTTRQPLADDDDLVAAKLGERGLFINAAIVLSPPTDWNAVLDRVTAVIPAGAVATLVSPYATPDLASNGWALIGHPPLMARLAAAPSDVPDVPELEVREVVNREDLEAFERTLVDGYPMPDLQPHRAGSFFDERVLGGPTRFWLGLVDGEPVATAVTHVAGGVNDVEMVATLESARGRGYGAVVTWAATVAEPSLPAILIASDLGRTVYERLGYTALSRWTIWMRS